MVPSPTWLLVVVLSVATVDGNGLIGLPQLPYCGMSATDTGLHRATGRGPAACTFLQMGSLQLWQGTCTYIPLLTLSGNRLGIARASPCRSILGQEVYSSCREQVLAVLSQRFGLELPAQTPAEPLGRAVAFVFSLVR